jgi:hypothetical protein
MNGIRSLAVALTALVTLSGTLLAQEEGEGPRVIRMMVPQTPSTGCGTITSPDGVATIPFEDFGNHVLIPVKVGGEGPYSLILDTGMPVGGVMLFSDLQIGNPGSPDRPKPQKAGGPIPVSPESMRTGVELELPGVKLTDQVVMMMPGGGLFGGFHKGQGVIGAGLFDHFVVQIDYDRMVVRVHEPDNFEYTGAGQEIPVTRNDAGHVVVACEATLQDGKRVPLRLTLDTGAGHNVSLNAYSHEDITVPEGAVEHTLGRTVAGRIEGHIGRIRELRLGKYVLENIVASFRSIEYEGPFVFEKEGNLGSGILSHFNVTYDLPNNRIFVQPSGRFNEPFEWSMLGLELEPEEGALRVERIVPNSPAEEAGIGVGDRVISIDGRPAGEFNISSLRAALREEGKSVVLAVSRGGKNIEIRVRLRRLI